MISITTLTPQQLRRAADIQEKIQSLQKELNHLVGSTADNPAVSAPTKRRISAAGRARIAAGAKARWAKIKGSTATSKTAPKRRRKISAAGRAAIAAAARARWAKAKAAGKTRL